MNDKTHTHSDIPITQADGTPGGAAAAKAASTASTMSTTPAATRESSAAGSRPDRLDRLVFRPRVDLLDREQEVLLFADMPGSRAEDIEIRFENGLLTVRGGVAERPGPEVRDAEGARELVREYRLGDFERSFTLGEQIDTDGIEASFATGVLTVRLPKLGKAQPRRIEVRAG